MERGLIGGKSRTSTLQSVLKRRSKKWMVGSGGDFSWKSGGNTSVKSVLNLPRAHEKLHLKGEPFWFIDRREQTDRDPVIIILGWFEFLK